MTKLQAVTKTSFAFILTPNQKEGECPTIINWMHLRARRMSAQSHKSLCQKR